ncbi:hypothetical protein TNCV_1200271 [Trichonephila clavipes]|uniref:Uncharacterized protein n=1 Tax=Trichonephila clavipes TaxID=2585209 RepID=A0A8X6V9E4_TRICX|nr:hypothetical protein TNCV_1200271 [Trichonephila clavipes]
MEFCSNFHLIPSISSNSIHRALKLHFGYFATDIVILNFRSIDISAGTPFFQPAHYAYVTTLSLDNLNSHIFPSTQQVFSNTTMTQTYDSTTLTRSLRLGPITYHGLYYRRYSKTTVGAHFILFLFVSLKCVRIGLIRNQ